MILETKPAQAKLSDGQRALLEKRLRGNLKGDLQPPSIPRRGQTGLIPVSFAQQRLWFLDQLAPNTALYNLPAAFSIKGPLNLEALEKALKLIVSRHEVLRSQYVSVDGTPMQSVSDRTDVEFNVTDFRQAGSKDAPQEFLEKEVRRPFDLSKDLMIRCTVARLADNESTMLLVLHHIAADAWSMEVLFQELAAAYEAFRNGREPELKELPIQYADYATWQREKLQGDLLKREIDYWKHQLTDAPTNLDLPTDHARSTTHNFAGGYESQFLPEPLCDALKNLGRDKEVTLYMVLLAAFQVLLSRYTNQKHIVVGSPIAGRTQTETEKLIGFFVNALALHSNLSDNPTFAELLKRVREMVLGAYAHQELPFEQMIDELHFERNSTQTPLISAMFVLQHAQGQNFRLPDLSVEPVALNTGTAKFDLTLFVEETASGLKAGIEYSMDLYEKATIQRMLGHLQALLEGIVANPTARISELPLMTEAERRQVLVEWNATQTHYSREKTIGELFEEQVAKSPSAIAVVCGKEALTYHQLDERANRLAQYLRKQGVTTDVMVGLCIERSTDLIVGLLGILKAGGAYVSLDPSYPKERLALMLEDIASPVLLTQEKLAETLRAQGLAGRGGSTLRLFCIDSEWNAVEQEPAHAPKLTQGSDSLAYVSFTSGSTGRPKGVCLPHRAVARLVKSTNYAQFGSEEVFLQFAPVAFDASTLEIWGALLNGGRLVVHPPGTPSLAELGTLIQKERITTLWLTAGLFHQMVEEQLDHLKDLRQLLAGGDVLSVPHVQRASEGLKNCSLINGYGPTENTTFTCCHQITTLPPEGKSIPIGRPISNTQVYVLDENMQPVPIGIPGELYTGGDGLARGYLNRPELTAEKFVPNPFATQPGERLYKTGDLVRWLADGSIEFYGRLDEQVKIRGYRIELGEIISVLEKHPSVRECAVIALAFGNGDKRLKAFVALQPNVMTTAEDLRHYLRTKLPEQMVPGLFEILESLPLNANGKVDRKALATRSTVSPELDKKYSAPKDELETQLVKIWEEILGIQPVGTTDKFFDLGGHSLLAVKLISQIEKNFGKRLPVAAVFDAPTIEQLAVLIRGGRTPESERLIVEIQPKGSLPALYFVHGVGGGMLWGYTNLSRCLGTDRPVYAFKSRGTDGREEFDGVEEMAARYVSELRAAQPKGPYYLGGYCFGGNVAYEMARQLTESGDQIAILILMNCTPPNSSYTQVKWTPTVCWRFMKNLAHALGAIRQWSPAQRRDFITWKMKTLKKSFDRLTRRKEPAGGKDVEEIVDLSSQPEDQRGLWEKHVRILMNHHPKDYSGNVALFRTRGHQLVCSFDEQYGWGELAKGGVTVKIVPGSHESILDEPYVRTVAQELKILLQTMESRREDVKVS